LQPPLHFFFRHKPHVPDPAGRERAVLDELHDPALAHAQPFRSYRDPDLQARPPPFSEYLKTYWPE
jgi:hypothetical protein